MRTRWVGQVTPWDVRALARSASLSLAIVALAVVITATTDEGGVAWSERFARAIPLVPVCAALAMALALAGARRRGEEKALEALGRSPVANRWGVALGALTVGALAALVIALDRGVSIAPFFPTVHASGPYTFERGTFTNIHEGWRVMADGSVALRPATTSPAVSPRAVAPLPEFARAAAALLTLLGTAAFVVTVAVTPRAHLLRAAVALFVTASASAVLLQAAAASRVSALLAPLPSLLLLASAWAIVTAPWPRQTRAHART